MKKSILLVFLVFMVGVTEAISQESLSHKKHNRYKSWIEFLDETKSVKGYLKSIEDDKLIFSESKSRSQVNAEKKIVHLEFDYRSIQRVVFREENRISRGALKGALYGGIGLGLIAVATNSPCSGGFFCVEYSDGQVFAAGLLLGGATGAVIGAILSNKKIKIPINGDQTTFENSKSKLKEYIDF